MMIKQKVMNYSTLQFKSKIMKNNDNKQELFSYCFWKRILAFNIDFILLAILGYLLGYFFESQFIQLGSLGRILIGLPIAVIYFGISNSQLCNGQTVGKSLMKIKVIDFDGNTIALEKSITRSLILLLPLFCNGLYLPESLVSEQLSTIIGGLLSFIIFGGSLAIVYLFIFNKKTRQSLHDLIFSTYVVNVEPDKTGNLKTWKGHYYISTVLVASLMISLVFLFTNLSKIDVIDFPMETIKSMQKDLLSSGNYTNVGITVNKTMNFSKDATQNRETQTLNFVLNVNKKPENAEQLLKDINETIISKYQIAKNYDGNHIVISYGYDIGISSFNIRHSDFFSTN